MVADTNVPMMVCITVCFFNITLEAAMSGVKRNISGRKVAYGKRYMRVKKRSVENVICPLIFQYRVTMVRIHWATKIARVICMSVVSLTRKDVRRNSAR